jgi:hypothetical protein
MPPKLHHAISGALCPMRARGLDRSHRLAANLHVSRATRQRAICFLSRRQRRFESEISWLSHVRLPRADELEATATGLYELRRSLYQQVPHR